MSTIKEAAMILDIRYIQTDRKPCMEVYYYLGNQLKLNYHAIDLTRRVS